MKRETTSGSFGNSSLHRGKLACCSETLLTLNLLDIGIAPCYNVIIRGCIPQPENEEQKMADDVKEVEKVNPFQVEVDAENAKRSGIGLRAFTGYTRGKGSIAIRWEAFSDDSKPTSMQEFLNVTKANEADLLEYAIVGFNDNAYTQASDPIAEHVNDSWDKDTKAQFRSVVRNLQKAMSASGATIESVVAMVKPGVEKAFQSKSK